ncbi:hypothetical protein G9A89_004290, partial [Geosiphon pyriformis]
LKDYHICYCNELKDQTLDSSKTTTYVIATSSRTQHWIAQRVPHVLLQPTLDSSKGITYDIATSSRTKHWIAQRLPHMLLQRAQGPNTG